MSIVQLTGKQSDFLKIVVAAAGRGDLETVCQLLDDNPGLDSHRGFTRPDDAMGSGIPWEIRDGWIPARTRCRINLPGCYHIQHRVEISPYCVARYEGRDTVAAFLIQQGATLDIHTAAYPPETTTLFARTLIATQPWSTVDTFKQ